jgi:polysaccharide export outer membrane protein
MKRLIPFLVSCFLFCGAALVGQDSASSGSAAPDSSRASRGGSGGAVGMVVGNNYVLKPSDVIEIQVYQEPDLDKTVRVEGDGTVALALIGKVKIAGMAVAEGKSLITDLYNRDYLVDPQISVLDVSFSPKVIHILGSVNRPGVVEIPPDRNLTLTEAMAMVNGVTRMGNPKAIKIKRVEQDGRSRQMEVNFSKIVTDPDVRDVVLKEGDTIWVPERII